VAAHRIIFSNACLHSFSDPGAPDSFHVQLTGLTIRGGQVTVDIVTADGRNIYHEKFAAHELLSDVEHLTPKQEEDHIRQRIAHFFDKDAFEMPALGQNEVFDGDYVNKDDWEDIHSNRSAIGFHFLRGSEYDLFIAYSRKKRKAVPYSACC